MVRYDIVIAGSGIAGIAAADAALERGLKPMILDISRDVGYVPSGAMFISETTYNKCFKKFENHINSKYDSVVWETNSGDREDTFNLDVPIYSMDREKLVRSMAADSASNGTTLKIMSSLLSVEREGDTLKLQCMVEGRKETIEASYLALGHKNIDDPLLKHSPECEKIRYYGNYSRGARQNSREIPMLRLTGDANSFKVVATWGKRWEKLSFKYDRDQDELNAINNSRVVGNVHDCLPSIEKNIFPLANLVGTTNIFGIDAGNSHRISYETTLDVIDHGWEEAMARLRDKWNKYIDENLGTDKLSRFMYHIPIGK